MAYKSKGFLGDGNIGVFKLGDSDVKLYLGDMLVYPLEEEWDIVATFNVTDTSSPTQLCYSSVVNQFSSIEIDGVEQSEVVNEYTFSTTGEHTVKYTLKDPTSIVQYAFINCSSLISIEISDSVTSIYNEAFTSCSSLTSCTIGSNVSYIDNYAFMGCRSLTNINIPDSLSTIGDGAFCECNSLDASTVAAITAIYRFAFSCD